MVRCIAQYCVQEVSFAIQDGAIQKAINVAVWKTTMVNPMAWLAANRPRDSHWYSFKTTLSTKQVKRRQ